MPNLRHSKNSPYFFSRYCGINFGPLLRSSGFPVSSVDYLCYLHDEGYDKLIKAGKSYEAYAKWNQYDEAMLNGINILLQKSKIDKVSREHIVTQTARAFLVLKKHVMQEHDFDKSLEDLEEAKYFAKQKFIEYVVQPNGQIEVESTTKESDYITPDRPPKRLPHSVSPKHPDLKHLLDEVDNEDEDLLLAVNLSQSFSDLPSGTQDTDTGGDDMSSGQLDATPITPAKPEYLWPNTKTVMLPYSFAFSATNLKASKFNQVHFRMTTVYDIIRSTMTAGTWSGAENALWPDMVRPYAADGAETNNAFTFNDSLWKIGNGVTEAPAMRKYWENFYKYYTVLGCEWEITVNNPSRLNGMDAMIGEMYTSRIKPPSAVQEGANTYYVSPVDAVNWKGIKWHTINSDKGQNGINNLLTLRGQYKRGQLGAGLEISNDDEREIWNPISSVPQVPEDLTLLIMRHPAAFNPTAQTMIGLNFYCRFKYIVQFKELKEQFEYPLSLSRSTWTQPISTWRTGTLTTEETKIKDGFANTTTAADGKILSPTSDEIDENMEEK